MTVGELIANKDYDFIEYRISLPKRIAGVYVFAGAAKSQGGELISLDDDCNYTNTEIVRYDEWSNDIIKNGLTVYID